MSKPVIYFFVKTFSKAEYAKDFLDGLLYMNSLAYFVKLESDNTDRADSFEGISSCLQPNQIKLEINGFHMNSEHMVGPVTMRPISNLSTNIFCMHAGYIGGIYPSEFATTKDFENTVKIPEQNIVLGHSSIVITNVHEFLRRVKIAANKQKVEWRAGLVNYYNPNTFHGDFKEEGACFNKREQFAHQREYRIVLRSTNSNETHYYLNIGNIRDIAYETSIEALNNGIKIYQNKESMESESIDLTEHNKGVQ